MLKIGKKRKDVQYFSTEHSHFIKLSYDFRDDITQFLSDLARYFYIRKQDIFTAVKEAITSIPTFLDESKQGIVTKIFWGRGNTYKIAAFGSISMLVLLSAFFFNLERNSTTTSQTSQFVSLASETGNSTSSSNQSIDTKNVVQGTNSITKTSTKLPQSNGVVNHGTIDWYKIQQGDTIDSIAQKYHVSADVLEWANGLSSPTDIKVGQMIHILPIEGVVYTVATGDTLASIATKYSLSAQTISDWNLLSSDSVTVGQKLLLPGATQQAAPSHSNLYAVSTKNPYRSFNLNVPATPSYSASGSSWFYSQEDPRWANYVLGGGYSAYSYDNIKNIGCLATDVAMIAKYYGYNYTPLTVASNPANFDGALFNWSGLGLFNVTPLGGLYNGYVSWSQINQQIEEKHPVIVSLGYNYHYVILSGIMANGDYVMNDPARGADLNFNAYFRPSEVTQAVVYTPR